MKTIYLVRHASAEGANEQEDFLRALTKKGRKEAKKVAAILAEDKIKPDLILSSPATRAVATAKILAKELGYPKEKIVQQDLLFQSFSPAEGLELIKALDDKSDKVLLIGHDPALSSLASYLMPDFKLKLSKAMVVGAKFDLKSWQDVSSGAGILDLLEFPLKKSKRAELEEEIKNEIRSLIFEHLEAALNDFDAQLTENMMKPIQKASEKLAQKMFENIPKFRLAAILAEALQNEAGQNEPPAAQSETLSENGIEKESGVRESDKADKKKPSK